MKLACAFIRATRLIGDLSFQPVAVIGRILLVGSRDFELDFELAVRVQNALAVLDHVVAVAVVSALFALGFRSFCLVFIRPPPRIIPAAINVVGDVGLFDRLAKKVARFD